MSEKVAEIVVEAGKSRPKPVSGPSAELITEVRSVAPKAAKNTSNLTKLAQDAGRRGS